MAVGPFELPVFIETHSVVPVKVFQQFEGAGNRDAVADPTAHLPEHFRTHEKRVGGLHAVAHNGVV